MHKIALFIATKKGYEVLSKIYEYDKNIIGLVCTFNEINVLEDYSTKIQDYCNSKELSFLWWKDLKESLIETLYKFKITDSIAIGWRYLIDLKINEYLENPLVVFHDSLLPRFRGFAPTPTAIICGEEEIGMTALVATEKTDEGPIIIQKRHAIGKDLYINDVIDIQSILYQETAIELIEMIKSNNVKSTPQEHSKATYSIWRSPEDCRIDWTMSSESIYNLIRAVSYPYTGAFTYMEERKVYIWKAEIIENIKFEKRDCGKIYSIDENGRPTIICGDGMIKLLNTTYEDKNEVIFSRLRVRLS